MRIASGSGFKLFFLCETLGLCEGERVYGSHFHGGLRYSSWEALHLILSSGKMAFSLSNLF